MAERWEWVEIIEPQTQEHMYANLTTGECVWEPPPGQKIKKTDDNQWWELFDQNTSRFYYYNATSQKTVWHRPQNCDIIPLAKLQTLKQNTEVRDDDPVKTLSSKREIGTQTPHSTPRRDHGRGGSLRSQQTHTSPRDARKQRYTRQDSASSQSSSSGRPDSGVGEQQVNGERLRRRGSQSSQTPQGAFPPSTPSHAPSLVRRDSFEMPPRTIIDSPRPQRSRSLHKTPSDPAMPRRQASFQGPHDLGMSVEERPYNIPVHSRHGSYGDQGSLGDSYPPPGLVGYGGRVEGYQGDGMSGGDPRLYSSIIRPQEGECLAFSQDIVNQQGNVSPIPQKPLKSTRSFPRTNPAYIGQPRRAPHAYKKLNVDTVMSGYDMPMVHDPHGHSHMGIQTSQSYPEYPDHYVYQRHERSDSDTSHSSNRAYPLRHDRTDSQTSHSSSRNRDLSDSQSSQGSLRNVSDTHSSQGSLRNLQDSAVSVQDSVSSKGSMRSLEHDLPPTGHERTGSQLSNRSYRGGQVCDGDNEPDYANLPPQSQFPPPPPGPVDPRILSDRTNSPYQSIYGQKTLEHDGITDQGFVESDGSVFSASPHTVLQPSPSPVTVETHHASLRRKKPTEPKVPEPTACSAIMEKSQSLQAELAQQRPQSMVVASQSEMALSPSIGSLNRQKLPSESDIENYAQHFNCHKKGLFGKKVPYSNLMTWSKEPLQKPLLKTEDKLIKKEALEVFKLIQMYMGDRKTKQDSLSVALDIVNKGWSIPNLRDEIYIQLCRQTTENKRESSLQAGWELMAICLTFFPPTHKVQSILEDHIQRHQDPTQETGNVPLNHFANHCMRHLERSIQLGAKRGVRKPSVEEVKQAKKSIFHPSMFGSTLDDILLMQRDRFPDRQLPWIQTVLSEEVLALHGAQTEGIFRVPGDIDEVNELKLRCDQWIPPTNCPDPHIPASLLKLWYRELYEPLIPQHLYQECITVYEDPAAAVAIVNKLPDINRLVLCYLIRFLQVFAAPENARVTKMDVNNLAMVMAPNCLRCESNDPKVIFENTRKEMGFLRTLIQNLDTSFMDGVL